jgi:hypothetical protein
LLGWCLFELYTKRNRNNRHVTTALTLFAWILVVPLLSIFIRAVLIFSLLSNIYVHRLRTFAKNRKDLKRTIVCPLHCSHTMCSLCHTERWYKNEEGTHNNHYLYTALYGAICICAVDTMFVTKGVVKYKITSVYTMVGCILGYGSLTTSLARTQHYCSHSARDAVIILFNYIHQDVVTLRVTRKPYLKEQREMYMG